MQGSAMYRFMRRLCMRAAWLVCNHTHMRNKHDVTQRTRWRGGLIDATSATATDDDADDAAATDNDDC